MSYATLKMLHVGSVALSGLFFVVRGVWMLRAPQRLTHAAVRILPHVIDTVLLASAVSLALLLRVNPLAVPWLAAKIGALLLYIVLGTVALRRGRTRTVRITAFVAALGVYAYIVAVALTRTPLPGTG